MGGAPFPTGGVKFLDVSVRPPAFDVAFMAGLDGDPLDHWGHAVDYWSADNEDADGNLPHQREGYAGPPPPPHGIALRQHYDERVTEDLVRQANDRRHIEHEREAARDAELERARQVRRASEALAHEQAQQRFRAQAEAAEKRRVIRTATQPPREQTIMEEAAEAAATQVKVTSDQVEEFIKGAPGVVAVREIVAALGGTPERTGYLAGRLAAAGRIGAQGQTVGRRYFALDGPAAQAARQAVDLAELERIGQAPSARPPILSAHVRAALAALDEEIAGLDEQRALAQTARESLLALGSDRVPA